MATPAPDPDPKPAYPYTTRLNIQFDPLELIDVQRMVDDCDVPWFNQTLCKVNDSVVRVGIVRGEYHWYKHDADDGSSTWSRAA